MKHNLTQFNIFKPKISNKNGESQFIFLIYLIMYYQKNILLPNDAALIILGRVYTLMIIITISMTIIMTLILRKYLNIKPNRSRKNKTRK